MTTLITVEHNGEELWWTLQELTSRSTLQSEFIVQCVELGLVDTSGQPPEWRFNSDCRTRLQKAWRLHRDLDLHVSALPLVLQLIDDLDVLRTEAQSLRVRLQRWEQHHR